MSTDKAAQEKARKEAEMQVCQDETYLEWADNLLQDLREGIYVEEVSDEQKQKEADIKAQYEQERLRKEVENKVRKEALRKKNATSKVRGDSSNLRGDYSRVTGNCSPKLHGDCSNIYGDCTGLVGDCSDLFGSVTGLSGDCTGHSGYCTGLIGNFSDEEPAKKLQIVVDLEVNTEKYYREQGRDSKMLVYTKRAADAAEETLKEMRQVLLMSTKMSEHAKRAADAAADSAYFERERNEAEEAERIRQRWEEEKNSSRDRTLEIARKEEIRQNVREGRFPWQRDSD